VTNKYARALDGSEKTSNASVHMVQKLVDNLLLFVKFSLWV
jgi:hypothetical protein